MRPIFLTFAATAFLMASVADAAPPRKPRKAVASRPAPRFAVELEQDGKPVPIRDHQASDRRAPFALLLTLPDTAGVYLSTSFDPSLVDTARSGQPFAKADFRTGICGAESERNQDHDLFLRTPADETLNAWGCDSDRFDQLTALPGEGCQARRTVESLFASQEKDGKSVSAPVPLANLVRRPLHLVFFRGNLGAEGPEKELGREWLTLFLDTVPDSVKTATQAHLTTINDGRKTMGERVTALKELAAMEADAVVAMDVLTIDARVQLNESAAVSELRTVLTAEAAYASVNGGFFDGPPCLLEPRKCRPKYNGDPFLKDFPHQTRYGYKLLFLPGPEVPAAEVKKAKASPSSLQRFVVVAWPDALTETGNHSFCAEPGRVCMSADSMPPVVNGHCAPGCTPVP
jgi:hypothetical protein